MAGGGLPLTEYGVLGDGRTAALVSRAGSLDWWCPVRFDAPSAFAALLDEERGGRFEVSIDGAQTTLAYEEGTNVLVHRFAASEGAARLWDFMVWPRPAGAAGSRPVRALLVDAGTVRVRARLQPRPGYASEPPLVEAVPGGVAARHPEGTLLLGCARPLAVDAQAGEASLEAELRAGDRLAFVLDFERGVWLGDAPDPRLAWEWLETTLAEWRRWDARTKYAGPYRDAVRRSALALKLLQHEATGAIVAAPTTSLPEDVGGVRNWDYRYVWMRDAWLLAEALYMVGHHNQASALLRWLLETTGRDAPRLRVLYPITPETEMGERDLPHLAGWRGSRPVRVGNAAHEQLQLDVYGEILAGLEACRLLGRDPHAHAWPFLRDMVDFVAANWRRPDSGIWEFRTAPRHFVHSKVLAWVALDRGVQAVRDLGLEGDVARWEAEADACKAEVLEKGWDDRQRAFVQSYGARGLDAANLMIPLVGFLPPEDPRVRANLEATLDRLVEGRGPLLRRYRTDDGLPGEEGCFVYCSYWLIDNLALQGRVAEAKRHFEAMLRFAGPLGLLGEEVDPRSGELLGNYPQGFSHIGLLRSALLLADLEGKVDVGLAERLTGSA